MEKELKIEDEKELDDMTSGNPDATGYDSGKIKILKGLEPVREGAILFWIAS